VEKWNEIDALRECGLLDLGGQLLGWPITRWVGLPHAAKLTSTRSTNHHRLASVTCLPLRYVTEFRVCRSKSIKAVRRNLRLELDIDYTYESRFLTSVLSSLSPLSQIDVGSPPTTPVIFFSHA
jgi:hypothetical protein